MFTLLLGSLLWLLGTSSGSSTSDILRFQGTNRVAEHKAAEILRFIPEDKLHDFEAESVSPHDKLSVGEHLDRFAATTIGCASPIDGDVIGGGPPSVSTVDPIGDVLRNNPVVVVGQVERLVPGWDVARQRPATLVKFRILEILSDPLRQFARQGHLSYLANYGILRAKGHHLCAEESSTTPVAVGDRIIAAGLYDAANPSNVETSPLTTFFIRDDMVVRTKEFDAGRKATPIKFSDIRRELSHKGITP